MKILNLYSGIGGNRKNWGNDHEIWAIENNEEIADIYHDFFPKDKVVIADAHQYLLNHYKEFDFIWSSPPCLTHSQLRKSLSMASGAKAVYPDMKLYEEILLLQHYFKGKYVVENVVSFYKPLIIPQELQRHYFWANFYITKKEFETEKTCSINDRERLSKLFGFNLDNYSGIDKRQVLRNCVLPELGLHIFKEAFREQNKLI